MENNPETEVVLGIAKRINNELGKMPPQTHEAIIQILGTLLQHRANCLQIAAIEQSQKQQFAKNLGLVPQP